MLYLKSEARSQLIELVWIMKSPATQKKHTKSEIHKNPIQISITS